MMNEQNISIRNGFRESNRAIVVYNSNEKRNYLIESGAEKIFSIPRRSKKLPLHYLLISMSPGAERLPVCKISLPSSTQVTFLKGDINPIFICSESGNVLKIPEGASTWQLQILALSESSSINPSLRADSTPTTPTKEPDNVTVGEDEDGG